MTLALTACFFSTLTVTAQRTTAIGIPDEGIYMDGNGLTYAAHKMTSQEMLDMKKVVGVREPGRNYNILFDGHGTGLAPPTEEEWARMVGQFVIVDSVAPKGLLAASVDLSANPTFPTVGNQQWQGSCAAWAATYYGYGYIESSDNGWTDAKMGASDHLMSAAWTYNKVNGGGDGGSWMSTNMDIIRDWGGATLATMPYNPSDPVSWGSMAAFREAPLHRASEVRGMGYLGQTTVDSVKTLLSSGTPITFAFDAGQYDSAFADGDWIMSAREYNSFGLNHAQTIVGYDDSIQDGSEKGAFRVVNSWGAGWGDGGFYWLTYDAFKELGLIGVLNLTYIVDIPDYVPSLLAVWHFNVAPTRSADPQVGIGSFSSPRDSRIPVFAHENGHRFPTFMALDMTEFRADYDAGYTDFFLSVGISASSGVISDFKVESYDGGYMPGQPTQVSGQSPDVPRTTPNIVTNHLQHYAGIPADIALDMAGMFFSSNTLVTWTAVDHHSYRGGSSMQSGDVGDLETSDMRTSVIGPVQIWFDWKVSSETGLDFLSFSIDGTKYAAISGDLDWHPLHYSIPTGPHTLTWEYAKSADTSERGDCGWVDNIIVDTAPPVTTALVSGNMGLGGWYVSATTITLSAADENGSGVDYTRYRVDGGAWSTYSSPFAISGNGPHFIDYYSVDLVGNTEVEKRANVEIDTTGPGTRADLTGTMGAGGWYVSPVSVSLAASDMNSGVDWTRFRIDGGSWQYGNLYLLDSNGIHLIEFESQDKAGNMGAADSVEIKVDQYAPATAISVVGTLGANGWYTSDVGLSFSAIDDTSGIGWTAYRIDSGAWQLYTGFFMVLADGMHTVEFYSEDLSGNREITANTTVSIDHDAPILQIIQTDGAVFNTASVTITWSAVDMVSGLDYIETSLDGGAFAAQPSGAMSQQLSGLSEGLHSITIRAVDAAGLSTEKSIGFTVDSLPPITNEAVAGTSGLDGWFVSPAAVTLSAIDATTGVKSTYYRVNGGLWQTYMAGINVAADRINVIEYYSTDNAGNTEGINSITVKIDKVGPTSTIGLGSTMGQNDWYIGAATYSLTAADATSGLGQTLYRIDGGAWTTYAGPFVITVDGTHLIDYYSKDAAGNVEARQTTSIKMDCAAPIIEIDSPMGDVDDSNVNILWRGRDYMSGLDRIELSVDGGSFEDQGTATGVERSLVNGNHTIILRASDKAGNMAEKQMDFGVHSLGSSNTDSTQSVPPWTVYALLAGIIASLFMLVIAVMARRKRQPEQRTTQSRRLPPPPPAEPPQSHPGLPPPPTD
jgi:hypothetical protein